MQCEVTIGIPVYKAVDYIEATMLSALAQTYESIEFLIVDDCGNDGTIGIVEHLQCTHPRGRNIRILHNEKNCGVAFSRNRIIDEAHGQYLYFLDSDDVIEPNTIELLINTMQANVCDIVYASYERVDCVDETTRALTQQNVYPSLVLEHPGDLALYAFQNYGAFQASVCNCLIDVAFLRDAHVRFINTAYWEDMAFTYELVTKVRKAALLPDVTYHYLCRPFSLSNYQGREKIRKEEVLRNISTIDYLKEKCSLVSSQPYAPYMCYNLEMNSFYIVCHVLKCGQRVVPSFSGKELQSCMRFPLPFSKLIRFRHKRISNGFLWLVSHLPMPLFLFVVKALGRKRGVL